MELCLPFYPKTIQSLVRNIYMIIAEGYNPHYVTIANVCSSILMQATGTV